MNMIKLCIRLSVVRYFVRRLNWLNRACTKIGNSPQKKDEKTSKDKRRVFNVYRYGGSLSKETPVYHKFELDITGMNMVLDAMLRIKDIDPTFTFRRSCREGICGSCAINVQGTNVLACITPIPDSKTISIRPLPHMYVIRDLVVDMTHFFNAYTSVRPYLIRKEAIQFGTGQYAQSPRDRKVLEGLYECVLCGCCSTSCPSYWWNGRRFLGPAALLQAYRWIVDSRDDDAARRLYNLRDDFKAFRCHSIMNCTLTCPKGLNPALAIAKLKRMVASLETKPTPELDPLLFAKDRLDQTAKQV